MALDATWGGTSANAYITEEDATDFVETEVFNQGTWSTLTTAQKEAALIEAARMLDAHQFIGGPYDADQAMQLPRDIAYDAATLALVQKANVLQAMCVVRNNGLSTHAERQAAGIEEFSEKIGEAQETVRYGKASGTAGYSRLLCPESAILLRELFDSQRIFRA